MAKNGVQGMNYASTFTNLKYNFALKYSDDYVKCMAQENEKELLLIYWPEMFKFEVDDSSGAVLQKTRDKMKEYGISSKKLDSLGEKFAKSLLANVHGSEGQRVLFVVWISTFLLLDDFFEKMYISCASNLDTAAYYARRVLSSLCGQKVESLENEPSRPEVSDQDLKQIIALDKRVASVVDFVQKKLPQSLVEMWYKVNYLTFTAWMRDLEVLGTQVKSVTYQEYVDIKADAAGFASAFVLLLDEKAPNEGITHVDPLLRLCSMAIATLNDVLSYEKEKADFHELPVSAVTLRVLDTGDKDKAFRKCIRDFNEMVRSLEISLLNFPTSGKESRMRIVHCLGAIVHLHFEISRYGWTIM